MRDEWLIEWIKRVELERWDDMIRKRRRERERDFEFP